MCLYCLWSAQFCLLVVANMDKFEAKDRRMIQYTVLYQV